MNPSSLSLREGREYLLELLKKEALLYGRFSLKSGEVSEIYVDVRRVSLHPDGSFWVGRLFTEELSHHPEIQAVGGPTLGADPLVAATILTSLLFGRRLVGFIVRKEPKPHGLRRTLEGPPIPKGTPVCILEDVVTTGGSVLRAIEAVEGEGLKVQQILAVLDREQGGGEEFKKRGYPYTSLFRLSELL